PFRTTASPTNQIYTLSLHDALPICTAIGYERLFEEEFGLKRTATHGGAFFGGPERSTKQTNSYMYAGTRPSQKYSFNMFMAYGQDRKSTRLNSSHQIISYAVFCLKK